MKERPWPGIATAVAVVWIFSNIAWLGIAGPIWRASDSGNPDPWIGFAGNVLGAAVTLLAATVAGIAAYRTIVPMQRQLAELVRQNTFAQYQKLRDRAGELKDELRLVYRVNSDLDLVYKTLSASESGARERLNDAIDRLREGIDIFGQQAGMCGVTRKGSSTEKNMLKNAYAQGRQLPTLDCPAGLRQNGYL